ncbi:MAG TPA: hypothetical protein VK866_18495 [Acidimicrobiales bacterium]|nr:hypothetical protein [Acidimicrobiales bacterium]
MFAIVKDDPTYRVVYLLHILTIVVAFAPLWVTMRLGRTVAELDADSRRRIGRSTVDAVTQLHFPALILSGLFGVVLILLSDDLYDFAQAWISIAFTLWFVMLGVWFFLLLPAERALAAEATPDGRKKVAMFGGIMHLLFVLMLVDMIWKPGV